MNDEAEPSVPEVVLPPPPEPPSADARPSPEDGSESARVLPGRAIAAVLALMLAMGTGGIAYGVFGVGDADGDGAGGSEATPSPKPGKSSSPGQPGKPGPKGPTGPGADLVISSLTRTQVVVKNVGEDRARRFKVSVASSTFMVKDGLRPGERASFEFPCRAGRLTAVADPTDRVEELDETDNSMRAGPFDCKKSDPSPPDDPSPSDDPSPPDDPAPPDDPSKGGSKERPDLTIRSLARDRIVVANIGNGSAGAFVVDVGKAGRFNVGRLSPGATKTFSFVCTRRPSARVDAAGDVRESNEDNNSRSEGPFACLADLVVSAIDAHSVTVQNIGVGGAGPSSVRVEGHGFRLPPIEPGGQFKLGYPCVGGFVHATADAHEEIAESNENNNSASSPVGACLMSRHTLRSSASRTLTWLLSWALVESNL